MSRIPAAEIAEVEDRAGGYCEACGRPAGRVEMHHRQARKQGGGTGRPLDVAGNLLRVHPACHGRIHAHPDRSRTHGFIVSEWGGDGYDAVPVIVAADLARW